MRFDLNRKIPVITLWCLFLSSTVLNGQAYRFKNYGNDSKIPDGFIYTLNQDNSGYLWIGTGSGLSKFDGFDFYNIAFPDSSISRFPTASLRDKSGKLWFGCNDGSVFFTEDGNLKPLASSNTKAISSLIEGPDGFIYIIQGESIIKVSPGNPAEIKEYSTDKNLYLFSACFTQSGNILIGTQENIVICDIKSDSINILSTIDGFDYSGILAIHKIKDRDIYLIGTNGNGLFKLELSSEGNSLTRFRNHQELDYLSIQSITEDSERNIWISSNASGIFQLKLSEKDETIESLRVFNKKSGLPGNSVKLVFQDIEGNYWIGLFGDGLSVLNSLAFSFYSPGATPEANNIIYVNKINNDIFLGTPAGYYLFDIKDNKIKTYIDLKQKTGKNEIASYCVDSENNIWIGTKGGGLFVRNAAGIVKQFYISGNSAEDYITDIATDKKYIWLGTLNGVRILSRKTQARLEVLYNIDTGLPHNSINQIFITTSGNAAIATKSDRLFMIDPEKGITSGKAIMSGTTMNEISSFSQGKDGILWVSTTGNGVFEYYGDSLKSFTRSDMMMSDYCYSILTDSLGRIWIGHDRGFSRYNPNTGIMRTYGTEFASSGRCNPDGMYESPGGKIFIGTTAGLIMYDRLKEHRPQLAPFNNINFITINNKRYPARPSYTLPYNKHNNLWVNYVGINLRDPDKVYYQTRLDNFDDNWSTMTTERMVPYTLGDGKYKFNMKSVNEDGFSVDTPISFVLIIKKPYWRSWWFILSSLLVITGVVIVIIRQREKAQKEIQEYLEKELDARTSIVIKQKGEIELQNIEITDSINYAKRIQTSILPDFNKLKETVADAFLFFRPRDIVSGDFYWFDNLDKDRFILVCADSTGHGVPGAFMSMIGSTLLQDIVTRQRITKPSEVLSMLDKQIFSTLNQNVELGVSNDGMDMVVCEISTKTRHIRFASAMRPVILVLDGEPFYIKGNRSSVGGESVIEKYFDDQEYYLNEGDTMYMFSDGLPDQFGGTDGKKMKIARLKKLIEDVFGLPMSGQKEVITKFYDEWKGDFDQVDDILLIGIRL